MSEEPFLYVHPRSKSIERYPVFGNTSAMGRWLDTEGTRFMRNAWNKIGQKPPLWWQRWLDAAVNQMPVPPPNLGGTEKDEWGADGRRLLQAVTQWARIETGNTVRYPRAFVTDTPDWVDHEYAVRWYDVDDRGIVQSERVRAYDTRSSPYSLNNQMRVATEIERIRETAAQHFFGRTDRDPSLRDRPIDLGELATFAAALPAED